MPSSSRRLLLIGAPALLVSGFTRASADRKTVAVRTVTPFLDRYLGLPAAQRSRFRTAYYVSRDGVAAAGLRGWIVVDDSRTPVRLGPDGRLSPLPTLDQWRRGQLELEAPADANFSVAMELEPTLASAAVMDAAPLAEAVDQAQAAVRRIAGVLRFAAPRFTRIVLVGAGSGRAALGDGREVALPAAGGHPVFAPASHPAARTITCARAPVRLRIAGDD